jgi:hypothetical protein
MQKVAFFTAIIAALTTARTFTGSCPNPQLTQNFNANAYVASGTTNGETNKQLVKKLKLRAGTSLI